MANKKRNKYSTWAKNFGQSVRFGAKEVLSEMSPSVAETIGSLPEDMRELKQDIRQLRSNKRQIVNYLLGEEEQFSKYAGIAWKNAKQSAKTGKLIDTKREEKLTMEAMGMDDMGFDDFDSGSSNDSFDFNDSESGGSFEDLDIGPSKIVNLTGPSNRAIGAVNESILEATEAVNAGFDRMDRSSKNAFAMSEALQKHFHSESMSKLDAINNNLTSIVQFSSDTLGTFVQASMEYYDKNLAVLNSINEAMLRISPPPKEKKELSKLENPIEMFMNGGFSLKGYAQLVAKNAKKSFDNGMLTGMIPMLNNEMLLSGLAANPIGSIIKLGMEAMIPDRFKKSLGQMDKTASNFIPAILTKLGEYKGENSFVSLLSEIFGVKTDKSVKRFRQGDYERGPMPFDGETKVAITRVIPGYLSRMTAILETIALSMKYGPRSDSDLESMIQEKGIIYNGSSEGDSAGSFMRRKDAIKTQQREERNVITRTYSDSRFDLRSAMNSVSKADRNTEIDDYLVGLTHSKEPMKPGDLDQIKKFMWIGAHNGKNPQNDEYKKDISDEAASDMQKVFDLLKVDKKGIMVGMYGSERHAARTNLSNYNRGYGSETEYGSGRTQFLSTINKGSSLDLRDDKDAFTLVNRNWEITKDEYGDYSMPSKKLEEFNERYGTRTKRYRNAKEVYDFLQKMKGTNDGKTEAEENVTKETEKTLTQQIKNIIEAPFNKMADLFDKVNEKMYEVIFGKDGLGGNIEELLLGKKDDKGHYSDGWFSEAINGVKDTYTSTKNYLFGGKDENGIPVEGILSNLGGKFTTMMNKYIFGEDEDEGTNPDGTPKKKASIIESMQATLVNGFGDLASVLFGNGNGGNEAERTKSLDEAKAAFKKAIPDVGKGVGLGAVIGTVSGLGGFGLLGSLFLPGGPIGGALVGGAVGLLSQSKGFREMLFGKEETDEQGNVTRVGGLISSKVVDWFKKKKTALGGGAAMGVLSTATGHGIAFGLMPSIAVGAFGPVIAGAAWGLLTHSERFRSMIFGRETKDENGQIKRVGGLINGNMMSKFKTMLPRGIAGAISGMVGMGVISQMGLIGSMVATGPIPAAILGAGFGIATASKDFTQRMFGYQDKNGEYHSGALDRMKNFFTVEIFEPLKLRIHEELFAASVYIRKNVLRPIRRAIFPIKELVLDIGKTIKDTLGDMFKPIKEGFQNIFVVMTDAMRAIFKPMISVVKTISSWLFKRFKTAMKISIQTALLPLRMVGGLARMIIQGKDYTSGVTTALGGVKNALANGTGLVGALGGLGKAVFNPETRLSEANAEDERLRKEDEQYELEGNAVLQAERKKMLALRDKIRAGGYNLTDEQIAEKLKASQQKATAEAKIVDTAAKSGDPMQQMTAKMIEQGAERGMKLDILHNDLVELKTGQKIANEAVGVKADDNASLVDEKKRLTKKEEAIQEREEKNAENLEAIKEGINKVSGDGKKDKSSWWSKIFDIGGGILGGLFKIGKLGFAIAGSVALITDILSFGFGDDTRKRKMIDSDAMGNMMTRGIRGGMKFGARAGIKLIDFMGEKVKDRKFIGKSYAVAADGTRTHVGNLYTKGQNRWESMMEKLHNITGKVSDKVKGAITKPDEQKGLIDKLLTAGSKALESIKNMDFIKNKKLPKAESVITVFQAVIDSVKKLMMKPKFMQRIAEYMATKGAGSVARGALKTGLGLLTGGMATVAFGAYDGVSGMARAGFYFDVNDEDVDWRMRIISGAVNAFFGLPLMFVYDFALSMISLGIQNVGDSPLGKLLSEFGINLANFDHRKAIAQLIYRMTADEVDVSKLDESQKKLLSEYKAYIDSHPDENMSLEEFQDKVKGQGGLWQKYGAPILNRIFGVDPLKNQGKTFMDRVHDAYEGLVKWFNNAVDQILNFHPLDYIKDKLSELFTPIKERWNKFTDFGNGGLSDEHKDKVGTWDRFKNGIANFFKRDKDAKAVGSSKIFGGNGKGFSQGDARWKNKSFGSSTFDLEACGPLALANITGKDPRMLAAMANPNDFSGSGIKPSYFRHTAGQLGLGYRENNTSQDMYAGLLSGKPMIVGGSSSNPNSPFYGNGHYVVANGLDSKGNANIYNPAGHGKSMSVDPKTLIRESLGHGGYSGSFSGGAEGYVDEDTAAGNGIKAAPEFIQDRLIDAAKSFLNKGIKYSQAPGRLEPEESGYTDCSGYISSIYKKVFGKNILTPYAGEFDDPSRPGQWNESVPIDESLAQPGDFVFWETENGVPDNHIGMVVDPDKHLAVASNTSTGPVEFQWDNSYWKPMLTGIRRPKIFAELEDEFSGGGRMSLSEAMKGNPKGNVNITQADIKKYNERQAQELDEYRQYLIDNDITTKEMSLEQYRQMVAKNKGLVDLKRAEPIPAFNSTSTNVIGYLDEESAAKLDSDLGISATTNGQTETITGPGGEKITRKVKGASSTKSKSKPGAKSSTGSKDDSLGIMDLITGFTLGLGNLFSAIWGGTKYKAVTLEDIKNGIGNKIKGLLGGFGASGDVQKRLLESAKSFLGKGIYYSQVNPGRLDPDTSGYTDCSGLTAAIYKKAFGENLLTPYGGEFDDPDRAGQWNESDPINEDDAQIGDLVFWETAKGVPDNHVGMVIDPANHKAVASNTSTGPAEVTWDDSYWRPMFTGIRRPKVLAELNKKYGGGGGSYDASEGHIETKKAVWNYLVNDLEMNREGAAGVMGNIEQESRFDTNAYNPDDVDGNPSGGLVQWHAGRFNNLKNYAAGIGRDWTDVQSQVGYLGQELNGPYEHVYDAMRNASSVNSAVDTWVRKFEIPADIPGEINKRTPMAEGFYRDHENFVGGANGFMSQPQMMMPGFGMMQSGGSSANALAAVLTGGLFNWKRRYDERGRLKKVDQLRKMINAGVPESQIPNNLLKYKAYLNEASGGIDPVKVLTDYANAHATQEPVNATVRNATADRILPAKVDTGGASMDDLLISIRALDSHAELNQIISYLAAIAENGGTGRNFIFDRKSDINMHRQIEMTKRDLRDASSKRILSRPALNNLENVLGDIDGMPVNSLALAQEIAKGGKFRTS